MKRKNKLEELIAPVILIGMIGMFICFAISIYKIGSGVKYKVEEYQAGLENEIGIRETVDIVLGQYLYSHAHEGLEGREVILYDEVGR